MEEMLQTGPKLKHAKAYGQGKVVSTSSLDHWLQASGVLHSGGPRAQGAFGQATSNTPEEVLPEQSDQFASILPQGIACGLLGKTSLEASCHAQSRSWHPIWHPRS